MGQILLFLIALVIIAVVFMLLISRWEAKKHGTSAKEEFVGICASAVETASKKEERKQKIIAMFKDKPELSNFEIREALGVTSRSVVRYMNELENRIEQVGNTGRNVIYRLKN